MNVFFTKCNRNVTCSFSGVLTVDRANSLLRLNGGPIPEQFKPSFSIVETVSLIAGNSFFGTARMVYFPDGHIEFIADTEGMLEFHHTASWISQISQH